MLSLPADGDGPLTLAEASHLWWFADGAIMDVDTREHLHRSWGLCTRHAWLYFRLEVELRVDPLGNAVLMTDLARHAVQVLGGHRSVRHKRAELTIRDSCFTCEYTGTGKPRFTAQQRRVNTGSQTSAWCRPCQRIWLPRMCAQCAPRADAASAVSCRQHAVDDAHASAELEYLSDLARRTARCQKSLTVEGPDRSADTDAALVEAIGWCCGWQPELAMRSWPDDEQSAC